MPHEEDPRIRVARRALALSWSFYTLYVGAMLAAALGVEPGSTFFGVPAWAALACFGVPTLFVGALIPLVYRMVPDIPLDDDRDGEP